MFFISLISCILKWWSPKGPTQMPPPNKTWRAKSPWLLFLPEQLCLHITETPICCYSSPPAPLCRRCTKYSPHTSATTKLWPPPTFLFHFLSLSGIRVALRSRYNGYWRMARSSGMRRFPLSFSRIWRAFLQGWCGPVSSGWENPPRTEDFGREPTRPSGRSARAFLHF